jgi:hypothetical protein
MECGEKNQDIDGQWEGKSKRASAINEISVSKLP